MTSLRQYWNHFWFEAAAPDNLGLCRIILFGSMFLYYLLTPRLFPSWGYLGNFAPWGSVSHAFWNPVWLMSVLHLPPASSQVLEVMQIAWRAALLFSCVGLFTRIATAISFGFGLYLFGVAASFGRIHHTEHVLIFSFLIMAIARCGDAWSVDALLRKARAPAVLESPVMSGEYTWPVRLIWVVIALIYFAAGISKVRHSGFEWINSDTMRDFLVSHAYHISVADPLTSWGPALARTVMIPRMLAACGMILELALPIALFSRRSRWVLVTSVAVMQFGVAVLLGPNFYQITICQLLWVPWDRVVAHLTRVIKARHRYSVVYDRA
jgi:Vitamin K-dependent gamma-carboxylase